MIFIGGILMSPLSVITGVDNNKVVSRNITIRYGDVEIDIEIDYRNNPNGEVVRCNTYNL